MIDAASTTGQTLESVSRKIGYVAVVVAGGVAFVSSGIHVSLWWSQIPTPQLLLYFSALLVWVVGLIWNRRSRHVALQLAAMCVLLFLPLVAADEPAKAWLPIPFIAFAIAFGAAFSLAPIPALVIIAFTAIAHSFYLWSPRPSVSIAADSLDGGAIGVVYLVVVTSLLLVLATRWRNTATRLDIEQRVLEQTLASDYEQVQETQSRESVDRRIHETVLNTLNVISNSAEDDGQQRSDLIRADVTRTLRSLPEVTDGRSTSTVENVIRSALDAGPKLHVTPTVDVAPDIRLSPDVAGVLRDVIVESLNNIQRYADASAVVISARENGDSVTVRIEDDGRGIRADSVQRFGTQFVLQRAVESIGGSTQISERSSGGTSVLVRIPRESSRSPRITTQPSLNSVTRSWVDRVALSAPVVFLIIGAPIIVSGLSNPGPSFTFILAYIALNIALIANWKTALRRPLAIAVAISAVVALLTSGLGADTCVAASSVHWLINGVTGGLVLAIFALANSWIRWLVLPAAFVAGAIAIVNIPIECQWGAYTPLITTAIYVTAALYIIRWLFGKFDSRHARDVELWAQSVEIDAQLQQQVVIKQRWDDISKPAQNLLIDIQDGVLDPLSREARARATAAESRIRTRLTFPDMATTGYWRAVDALLDSAVDVNVCVRLNVIDPPTNPEPLPESVCESLHQTVRACPESVVGVRFFTDLGNEELAVIGDFVDVQDLWAAAMRDARIDIDQTDDGNVIILLSRPALSEADQGRKPSSWATR